MTLNWSTDYLTLDPRNDITGWHHHVSFQYTSGHAILLSTNLMFLFPIYKSAEPHGTITIQHLLTLHEDMSFLTVHRKRITDSLLYLCNYLPVCHSPCYKCTSSFETCCSSVADDSLPFSRQQYGLYLSVSLCHTPYLPCLPSHITLSLLSIWMMAGWNLLSAIGPAEWSLIQEKASTTAWCSLMSRDWRLPSWKPNMRVNGSCLRGLVF